MWEPRGVEEGGCCVGQILGRPPCPHSPLHGGAESITTTAPRRAVWSLRAWWCCAAARGWAPHRQSQHVLSLHEGSKGAHKPWPIFLACTGGGRNPVTNRLLRHFNFISFTDMSDDSINRIFTTILGAFFRCVYRSAHWCLPWTAFSFFVHHNPRLISQVYGICFRVFACMLACAIFILVSTAAHQHYSSKKMLSARPPLPPCRRYFNESIQGMTQSLMAATIQIYNSIRADMLPTPSKSHYTFNLRDLSKVVQGCMRADPKSTSDRKQVMMQRGPLWYSAVGP